MAAKKTIKLEEEKRVRRETDPLSYGDIVPGGKVLFSEKQLEQTKQVIESTQQVQKTLVNEVIELWKGSKLNEQGFQASTKEIIDAASELQKVNLDLYAAGLITSSRSVDAKEVLELIELRGVFANLQIDKQAAHEQEPDEKGAYEGGPDNSVLMQNEITYSPIGANFQTEKGSEKPQEPEQKLEAEIPSLEKSSESELEPFYPQNSYEDKIQDVVNDTILPQEDLEVSDGIVSDESVSDESVSDESVSDESVSDESVSDESESDESESDESESDESESDESESDGSVSDGSVSDGSVSDGIVSDGKSELGYKAKPSSFLPKFSYIRTKNSEKNDVGSGELREGEGEGEVYIGDILLDLRKTVKGELSDEDYTKKVKERGEEVIETIELLNLGLIDSVLKLDFKGLDENLFNQIASRESELGKVIEGLQAWKEEAEEDNEYIADINNKVAEMVRSLEAVKESFSETGQDLIKIQSGVELAQTLEVQTPALAVFANKLNECVDEKNIKVDFAKQIVVTKGINAAIAKNKYAEGSVPCKALYEKKYDLSITNQEKSGLSEAMQEGFEKLKLKNSKDAKSCEGNIEDTKSKYQDSYDTVKYCQINNNLIIQYTEEHKKLDAEIKKGDGDIKILEVLDEKYKKAKEEQEVFLKGFVELIKAKDPEKLKKLDELLKSALKVSSAITSLTNTINKKSDDAISGKQVVQNTQNILDDVDGLTANLIINRFDDKKLLEQLRNNLGGEEAKSLKALEVNYKPVDLTKVKSLNELSSVLKESDKFLAKQAEESILKIVALPLDQLSKIKSKLAVEYKNMNLGEEFSAILNKKIDVDNINNLGFGEFSQDTLYKIYASSNAVEFKPNEDGEIPLPPPPPPPQGAGINNQKPNLQPPPPPQQQQKPSDKGVTILDLIIGVNHGDGSIKKLSQREQEAKEKLANIIETIFVNQIKEQYTKGGSVISEFVNQQVKLIKAEEEYKNLKQSEAQKIDEFIEEINLDDLMVDIVDLKDTKQFGGSGNQPQQFLIQNKNIKKIVAKKEMLTTVLKPYNLDSLLTAKLSDFSKDTLKKAVTQMNLTTISYNKDVVYDFLQSNKESEDLNEKDLESIRKQVRSDDLNYIKNAKAAVTEKNKEAAQAKKAKSQENLVKEAGLNKLFDGNEDILDKDVLAIDLVNIKIREIFQEKRFKQKQEEIITQRANEKIQFLKDKANELYNSLINLDENLQKEKLIQEVKQIISSFGNDFFDTKSISDQIELNNSLGKILALDKQGLQSNEIPKELRNLKSEGFIEKIVKLYDAAKCKQIIKSQNPGILDFNVSKDKEDFYSKVYEETKDKYTELASLTIVEELSKSKDEVKSTIKEMKAAEFFSMIKTKENQEYISKLVKDFGGELGLFAKLVTKDSSLTKILSEVSDAKFVDIFREELAPKWKLNELMKKDLMKINKDYAKVKLEKIKNIDLKKKEYKKEPIKTTETTPEKIEGDYSEYSLFAKIKEMTNGVKKIIDEVGFNLKEINNLGIVEAIQNTLNIDIVINEQGIFEVKPKPLEPKPLKPKPLESNQIYDDLSKSVSIFAKYYYDKLIGNKDSVLVKLDKNLEVLDLKKSQLNEFLKLMEIIYERNLEKGDTKFFSAIISSIKSSINEIEQAYPTIKQGEKVSGIKHEVEKVSEIKREVEKVQLALNSFNEVLTAKKINELNISLKKASMGTQAVENEINKQIAEIFIKGLPPIENKASFFSKLIELSYLKSKTKHGEKVEEFFNSDSFKNYSVAFNKAVADLDVENNAVLNNEKLNEFKTNLQNDGMDIPSKVKNVLKQNKEIANIDFEEVIDTNFVDFLGEDLMQESLMESSSRITQKRYALTGKIEYIESYLDDTANIISKLTKSNNTSFDKLVKNIEGRLIRLVKSVSGELPEEVMKLSSLSESEIALLDLQQKKDIKQEETKKQKTDELVETPPPPPLPDLGPPPPPPQDLATPPPLGFATQKPVKNSPVLVKNKNQEFEKINTQKEKQFQQFLLGIKGFLKSKHQEDAWALMRSGLEKEAKVLFENDDLMGLVKEGFESLARNSEESIVRPYQVNFYFNEKTIYEASLESFKKAIKTDVSKKMKNLFDQELKKIVKSIEKLKDEKSINLIKSQKGKLEKSFESFYAPDNKEDLESISSKFKFFLLELEDLSDDTTRLLLKESGSQQINNEVKEEKLSEYDKLIKLQGGVEITEKQKSLQEVFDSLEVVLRVSLRNATDSDTLKKSDSFVITIKNYLDNDLFKFKDIVDKSLQKAKGAKPNEMDNVRNNDIFYKIYKGGKESIGPVLNLKEMMKAPAPELEDKVEENDQQHISDFCNLFNVPNIDITQEKLKEIGEEFLKVTGDIDDVNKSEGTNDDN